MEVPVPRSVRSAVVFGHADADGHLAAEYTREHLQGRGLAVEVIVSPKTRNFRFWKSLTSCNIEDYDLVVCVDISFRFRDPKESLDHFLKVSDRYPEKHFIVVDHHSLVRPRQRRANVTMIEVSDPYECCLGTPDTELMPVAALCDGSPTVVVPTMVLRRRALGVKRAAADVRGLAGDRLLELIRNRRWDFFEALADEDAQMHRSVRGFRRRCSEASPLLEEARRRLSSEKPTQRRGLSRSHLPWHESLPLPQEFSPSGGE